MECLGEHTFPEQRQVTQLVENKTVFKRTGDVMYHLFTPIFKTPSPSKPLVGVVGNMLHKMCYHIAINRRWGNP